MNDEQGFSRCRTASSRPSRFSSYSTRHFDFLDPRVSVFSRASYYSDMQAVHPWLRRPYSRFTGIPLSTLRAGPCSERTEDLARPKLKRERLIRQEFFDNALNFAYSTVKPAALTTECSDRVKQLSRPKSTPAGYKPAYDLPREVPETALKAHLTKRVDQLAKPRHSIDSYKKSLWSNQRFTF